MGKTSEYPRKIGNQRKDVMTPQPLGRWFTTKTKRSEFLPMLFLF